MRIILNGQSVSVTKNPLSYADIARMAGQDGRLVTATYRRAGSDGRDFGSLVPDQEIFINECTVIACSVTDNV